MCPPAPSDQGGISERVDNDPSDPSASKSEQTRRRLLMAGKSLLEEHPSLDVAGYVRSVDVTRRAQMSSGSLYYHWDNQAEFADELARYVLDEMREDRVGRLEAHLRRFLYELTDGEKPFGVAVRDASESLFAVLANEPSFAVQIGLWAAQDRKPAIAERLRAMYANFEQQWLQTISVVLRHERRVMRPPFDEKMLATLAVALTEGLLLRHHVEPSAFPDMDRSGSTPWGLLSTSLLGLYVSTTCPDDRPATDLRDLV
nr:TetR/AcrR family transcriptional regulator [Micromonospora sp. DSM 115978]